jgi:S1-C subfamily serine protease
MQNIWQQLSQEITEGVAKAGRAIVAVDGRSGHTSSGIVWRAGFVVTAAHTVRSGANTSVIVTGGRRVPASLAGRDHGADIAVLKIDEQVDSDITAFGDTTSLAVGEIVVAVARTRRGNIVASSGILGGLMSEWRTGRTRIDQFIRPDLTLYPGFSGGALVGAGGTILGMTAGGGWRGKPITIPPATLTRVAEELAAKGHVARPYVGLVMQPVPIPESLQKKAGMNVTGGLLVVHVEAGGPGDAGGILMGDILVDLDGQACDDVEDLHDVLLKRGANQEVKAALIRGGQKLELTIKIGERSVR